MDALGNQEPGSPIYRPHAALPGSLPDNGKHIWLEAGEVEATGLTPDSCRMKPCIDETLSFTVRVDKGAYIRLTTGKRTLWEGLAEQGYIQL